MGCLVFGLSACALGKRAVSPEALVDLVVRRDCAAARLQGTRLLVGLYDRGDTTFVAYPADGQAPLRSTDPVQIGSVTASYFVPEFLTALRARGLGPDSLAFGDDGAGGAKVRYRDLLLHHSGVGAAAPKADAAAGAVLASALRQIAARSGDADYRFTHLNYALARLALARRGGADGARSWISPAIANTVSLPDSVRARLPVSQTEDRPVSRADPTLYAATTGGVASAQELFGLLDALRAGRADDYPAAPTLSDRPDVFVTYGWHILRRGRGRGVFLATGHTRYYGAAVVYYPYTETGVVVVATAGRAVDCVALDILRNVNRDWRREPSPAYVP